MRNSPSRPPLRFHGSKWRIADWIIEHFPPHECYVEPYGGGASVLLRKPRSWLEVFNDKNNEIVNFFRVLRENTDELVRLIMLTPWAVQEWREAQQGDPDPVEAARRFYVRSWQSIAGPTAQWSTGWCRQRPVINSKRPTPTCISFMSTDHLYQVANRLRGVQIECSDALDVIERYDSPKTLFYLDPPYPALTRGRWHKAAYKHEMSDDQHRELAQVARSLGGMVIISSYQSDLYDELYGDWERVEKEAHTQRASYATEFLWLSPRAAEARFPLFSQT